MNDLCPATEGECVMPAPKLEYGDGAVRVTHTCVCGKKSWWRFRLFNNWWCQTSTNRSGKIEYDDGENVWDSLVPDRRDAKEHSRRLLANSDMWRNSRFANVETDRLTLDASV